MFKSPKLIIDDIHQNSKVYSLCLGTNLIGSAPYCNIIIGGSSKISSVHSAVIVSEDEVVLLNFNGENNVTLTENTIQKQVLQWGDSFLIGEFSCLFTYDKAASVAGTSVISHGKILTTTSIVSDFSRSGGTMTTIGIQQKELHSLFYFLVGLGVKSNNFSEMIAEFINHLQTMLHCEGIGIRYRGYSFFASGGEIFEFQKALTKELFYDETSGRLMIPLYNGKGFCELRRLTGFAEGEIVTLTAVLFILDEICHHRDVRMTANQNLMVYRSLDQLIGKSAAIQKVRDFIQKVGTTNANILILGQSGTGKEIVAQEIHKKWESDDHRPFVAVNCAAIPSTLFESEFFGHSKGSFTGANESKIGFFEQANGGTLFLDELGEMPMDFQSKLLRVIETGEVRPIGASETIMVDVRMIGATNQDLQEMVSQGLFREDLFYRLQVLEIFLPPLKERKEDIPLLVDYFSQQLAKQSHHQKEITNEGMREIQEHDWLGNIRELKNFLTKIYALTDARVIDGDDVKRWIKKRAVVEEPLLAEVELVSLEEIEARHILAVLQKVQNNKAEAAKILGITRSTLYEKLRRISGLDLKED